MGHFCPQGSGTPKLCPVGSFLPEPGAFSPFHCRPCPPGKYCLSPGASEHSGLCDAGFFCPGGADVPAPRASLSQFSCLLDILEFTFIKTDFSNYSGRNPSRIKVAVVPLADSDHNVNNSAAHLRSPHYKCSTYRGDICPKGFFCPLGSAFPQACEAGFYCNQTGLEAPAGSCAAGYYCPRGSSDPYINSCPTGHYCPVGTPLPMPCPPGTIKRSPGGSTVETCQSCPPGHYCQKKGMAEPSGRCAEGYFCPNGQSSERPQQHVCSMGHYCEKGSVRQTPCLPSSYQPRQGQGSCETCPLGFYCPDYGKADLWRREKRGFF
ncbi:uncharacterized protein [Nothobranchius furzeri]|uniref:uncharacterized protein n=1 Tax=Nothobranchius furzeri TaxID=105023 RepID=UPI003904C52E